MPGRDLDWLPRPFRRQRRRHAKGYRPNSYAGRRGITLRPSGTQATNRDHGLEKSPVCVAGSTIASTSSAGHDGSRDGYAPTLDTPSAWQDTRLDRVDGAASQLPAARVHQMIRVEILPYLVHEPDKSWIQPVAVAFDCPARGLVKDVAEL